MAIDSKKVKEFWDARASRLNKVSFESIANLEEDPKNLDLKIRLETDKVCSYLGSIEGKTILDLGAGVGQWAFRFLERGAKSVVAVEYSAALAEIGRDEAQRRGATNLSFVVSPAEEFASDKSFDIIYISGLFVYMNDEQADRLVERVRGFCSRSTVIVLRDGTSILQSRHELNNVRSAHLDAMYSAVYRTREEYRGLFAKHGLSISSDENMFDEGCPLNKYPETRLRVYRLAVA